MVIPLLRHAMILEAHFSSRSCLEITCRLCSIFDHLPMCRISPLQSKGDIWSLEHYLIEQVSVASRQLILRLHYVFGWPPIMALTGPGLWPRWPDKMAICNPLALGFPGGRDGIHTASGAHTVPPSRESSRQGE